MAVGSNCSPPADNVQPTDPVRRFCEEYVARLSRGESAEFTEVEAQKRLDRLEAFMKAAAYAEARTEIDVLRGRYYGRTQVVVKANARIEECLQEIAKKGGEQLNKANKEQKYQKLLDRVSEEQATTKKAHERPSPRSGAGAPLILVGGRSGMLAKPVARLAHPRRRSNPMMRRTNGEVKRWLKSNSRRR